MTKPNEEQRPTVNPEGLALLRTPFPAHQISKLPKPRSREAVKGHCQECGGWHGLPAVHLDYVGHAALTDRLLDADPSWNWHPIARTPEGLPLIDSDGGLWIALTVCGITRLGYGDADGKRGASAMKERIGDALRNAAMRFGAALGLWHRGDLHLDEGAELPAATPDAQTDTQRVTKRLGRRKDTVESPEESPVPLGTPYVAGKMREAKTVDDLKRWAAEVKGGGYSQGEIKEIVELYRDLLPIVESREKHSGSPS